MSSGLPVLRCQDRDFAGCAVAVHNRLVVELEGTLRK
jgi:hypothetical protein